MIQNDRSCISTVHGQFILSCQIHKLIHLATFFLFQQGKAMPRKNLAKMAAALYACIELHKIGELDDNLLPVRNLSDDESESEEEDDESPGKERKKAGTKKRKRVYERKVRIIRDKRFP